MTNTAFDLIPPHARLLCGVDRAIKIVEMHREVGATSLRRHKIVHNKFVVDDAVTRRHLFRRASGRPDDRP